METLPSCKSVEPARRESDQRERAGHPTACSQESRVNVAVCQEEREVSSSKYVHARASLSCSPSWVFSSPLLALTERAKAVSSAQHDPHHLLLAVVFSPLWDTVPKVNDKPGSPPLPWVWKEVSSL